MPYCRRGFLARRSLGAMALLYAASPTPARADFLDDVRRTFKEDIPRTFEHDIPRFFGAEPGKPVPPPPKAKPVKPAPPQAHRPQTLAFSEPLLSFVNATAGAAGRWSSGNQGDTQ